MLDAKTGQYYYHYFYFDQPDLNWRNPSVEQAMFDVTRWWYQHGAAGFRLDAVDTLFEDPQLQDNPVQPGLNKYGDPIEEEIHNKALPEVHNVLRRLRKVADQYGAVLIGETWTPNIERLRQYYGERGDELQMPMDFLFTNVNKLSAPEFRKQIAAADSSGGWPVYLFSNHDIVRSYVRYGDGVHNDQIAKLMAALYLTLRGTAIMYYGEEIGMENNDPAKREDVKDPIGKLGWPKEKGRDGERTPMQWNSRANAGFSFSPAKPWLPVPPSYVTHNVATEEGKPDSILRWYKQLLQLRHNDPALVEGKWVPLNESDDNVLAYLRHYKNEAVLVALNMSGSGQKVHLDLASQGFRAPASTLMSTSPANRSVGSDVTLEPFGVYVGRLRAVSSSGQIPGPR